MSLKAILVHVDNGPHSPARIDAALGLAAAHDAHLIGLYVITRPVFPEYIRAQIPDSVLEVQTQWLQAASDKARAMFEEHVQRAGVRGEWRSVEGPLVSTLSLHGRYADLAVIGQRDPRAPEGSDDPAMPDRLILSIGRPTLVVPYAGAFPSIGQRVLVAWDASRLATRAVNDALPLLTKAKQVVVMAINPRTEDEEGGHGEIPSADICLHLARHGINAEARHLYADDIGVGDLLLSRVVEEGIDLIVCGAYGHARWRELVLGGVTRHLLGHMPVPVLMSH